MKSRIIATFASAALAVTVLSMTAAHAVAIVSGPGAAIAGFGTPHAVAHPGAPLTYLNADTDSHNVVSKAYGPNSNPWCSKYGYASGRCPLFRSDDLSSGEYGDVFGVGALQPGATYEFFCSYHATTMKGTLHVE